MTHAAKLATRRTLTTIVCLVVCLGSSRAQATGQAAFADQGPAAALALTDLARTRLGSYAGINLPAISGPPSTSADLRLRRLESQAVQALATVRRTGKRVQVRAARRALQNVRMARLAGAGSRGQMAKSELALSEIQAQLRPGEVFISYGQRGADIWAVVITAEKSRATRLGSKSALAALQAQCIPTDSDVDQAGCAARLRAAYGTPLNLPASLTRVVVASDPSITRVPLALVFGSRDVVRVVGHGTARRQASQDTQATSDVTRVAGFGDPDFDAEPFASANTQAHPITRSGNLARLRETAAEVAAISDVAYLRAEASESRLRALLRDTPRWRALHLTGHGHFDAAQPRLSGLQLTRTQTDDGLLTAYEVARMQIDIDLVVLSACETGLVGSIDGQACFGLSPAFLAAGARSVLSSLWRVDDAATRALMVHFHEGWERGLTKSAALRAAQTFVRSHEAWQHPHYWAGWTLWAASV